MVDIKQVADSADIIVNGYAYTRTDGNIRVLNLKNTKKAALINKDGETLETSMDDIELAIVKDYYQRNREYMEE